MLKIQYLQDLRARITAKKNAIAQERETWQSGNTYYYSQILNSLKFFIPAGSSVLHINCGTGFILERLAPSRGVGVDDGAAQIEKASQKKLKNLAFLCQNPEELKLETPEAFDYILVSTIEELVDIKAVLDSVSKYADNHTRIILTNYNYLWNPLVNLAEKLKLKYPQELHNWVSPKDMDDFLRLSGLDVIATDSIVLCPYYIPLVSWLLNRFAARLPFLNNFPMIQLSFARKTPQLKDPKEYSISVVVPCRNEVGNIQNAVERIPAMGKHTEIIFCDDKSTDGTPEKVREMIKKYPEKDIKLVAGPGICKARNVWAGFDSAAGDILLILDADLSVVPEELPYFFEAITKGYGEFINGSRLVYPMRDGAMRFLNVLGNKFFSMLFSFILDIPLKDTLCGTKVLWRTDYLNKVKPRRGTWGEDRWGDYDLIFGAAKNLKIIELPVHYMDRTYGETKMTGRFRNGWIMLKMCQQSMFKTKFH